MNRRILAALTLLAVALAALSFYLTRSRSAVDPGTVAPRGIDANPGLDQEERETLNRLKGLKKP